MNRCRPVEEKDDKLRLLRLQAHQISGMMDPTVPIRTLLNFDPAHAHEQDDHLLVRKLSREEVGRVVNDQLAPRGHH